MCSVSAITNDWVREYNTLPINPISRWEFDLLRAEVEKLKEELKEARQKDIEENAPDCEMKESVEIVKKLAEKLGVDLENIFEGHK